MWVAIMDSANYEWVGLGNTEREALEAIRKRYNAEQKKMEKDGYKHAELLRSVKEMMEEYGYRTYKLDRGQADYR